MSVGAVDEQHSLNVPRCFLQIFEAADVIQKLYLISQELPSGKYVHRSPCLSFVFASVFNIRFSFGSKITISLMQLV